MNDQAFAILQAASADNGTVLYIRTMGTPGVIVQAGKQNMIPDGADKPNGTALDWRCGRPG